MLGDEVDNAVTDDPGSIPCFRIGPFTEIKALVEMVEKPSQYRNIWSKYMKEQLTMVADAKQLP